MCCTRDHENYWDDEKTWMRTDTLDAATLLAVSSSVCGVCRCHIADRATKGMRQTCIQIPALLLHLPTGIHWVNHVHLEFLYNRLGKVLPARQVVTGIEIMWTISIVNPHWILISSFFLLLSPFQTRYFMLGGWGEKERSDEENVPYIMLHMKEASI